MPRSETGQNHTLKEKNDDCQGKKHDIIDGNNTYIPKRGGLIGSAYERR